MSRGEKAAFRDGAEIWRRETAPSGPVSRDQASHGRDRVAGVVLEGVGARTGTTARTRSARLSEPARLVRGKVGRSAHDWAETETWTGRTPARARASSASHRRMNISSTAHITNAITLAMSFRAPSAGRTDAAWAASRAARGAKDIEVSMMFGAYSDHFPMTIEFDTLFPNFVSATRARSASSGWGAYDALYDVQQRSRLFCFGDKLVELRTGSIPLQCHSRHHFLADLLRARRIFL